MRILIESVSKDSIPRGDVADYAVEPDVLHITVAELPDWRMMYAMAFHELTEYGLLKQRGIDVETVNSWDATHELKGDDPAAPYHSEHLFAENLERLFAQALELDWTEEYGKAVDGLCEPQNGL